MEASLAFTSRTNVAGPHPVQDTPKLEHCSNSGVHSYPPTPPAVKISPPSPSAVHAKLEKFPKGQKHKPDIPTTQVTQFCLIPHSTQPVQPTSDSVFARVVSALKNHRPSHSNSFTLSRIPANTNTPLSSPPPYVGIAGTTEVSQASTVHHYIPLLPPVLVFHDRTPVLTVRSLTGLLEIDREQEQLLGVETSFWVAVALTYLEFLEEREVCGRSLSRRNLAKVLHFVELSGSPLGLM